MRVIMTSANFSPAGASRRAKYDGDFWFQTLLGEKSLGVKEFSVGCSGLCSAVPEEKAKVSHAGAQSEPKKYTFSLAAKPAESPL